MRHVRCSVKQSVDTMAAVALHNTVAMRLNMLLDYIADFAVAFTGLHDANGLLQCLVRHFNQILVLFRHISNEESLI